MTRAEERGLKLHEEEQGIAWLQLTPAQRFSWLEEAKRFAEASKSARKITADDRACCAGYGLEVPEV